MRTQIAVTDTHALIWYARGKWRQLGTNAKRVYERAEAGRAAVYVPTLALAELFQGARKGSLTLGGSAREWLENFLSSGSFFTADLTPDIVLRAEELYGIPERGDRLIAATAALLDAPLITRDPEIARVAGVEVIW